MFKLLFIAACAKGMTSQVIEFATEDERTAAQLQIEMQSSDIGEVVCICL